MSFHKNMFSFMKPYSDTHGKGVEFAGDAAAIVIDTTSITVEVAQEVCCSSSFVCIIRWIGELLVSAVDAITPRSFPTRI